MAEDRATDWAADVRKYAADADEAVIAGIVRYCGIALRKRDSSLVSMTDPKETARVRENFLKKKLGLTDADDVLDAAIAAVGETMRAENFKHRVTVYYLLADRFGALDLFRKTPRTRKAAPVAAPSAEPEEDHKLADTIAAVVHDAGAVAGAVAGAFAGTGIGAGAVAGSEAAELAAEEVAPDLADRAHDPAPSQTLVAEAAAPEPAASGGTGTLWLWLVIALLVIVIAWGLFGRG